MKKNRFILSCIVFVFLLVLGGCSVNNEPTLVKSIESDSSALVTEQQKITKNFTGRIISCERDWRGDALTTYTYSGQDINKIKAYGSEGGNISKTTYTYSGSYINLLLKCEYVNYWNNMPEYTISYQYDNSLHLSKILIDYNNTENDLYFTFEYNTKGQIKKCSLYKSILDKLTHYITYTYYSSGNLYENTVYVAYYTPGKVEYNDYVINKYKYSSGSLSGIDTYHQYEGKYFKFLETKYELKSSVLYEKINKYSHDGKIMNTYESQYKTENKTSSYDPFYPLYFYNMPMYNLDLINTLT
jgi:hypothetical protein